MIVVIASANQGKIEEFKTLLPIFDIKTYKELLGDIEIVEDGNSFKENAIKKAQTIYDNLNKKFPNQKNDFLVISDDSGISVPVLDNKPGIYSARYAGDRATDKENNLKLISQLKEKNINKTIAYYTACIALIYKDNIWTTHGWMYGEVITKEIGEGGFGYDPMFIPDGYDKTLGELEYNIKKSISHRTKALNLLLKIIRVILSQNRR